MSQLRDCAAKDFLSSVLCFALTVGIFNFIAILTFQIAVYSVYLVFYKPWCVCTSFSVRLLPS